MGTTAAKETLIMHIADVLPQAKGASGAWRRRHGLPALVLTSVSLLLTACGSSPGSHVAQLGSTTTSASQSDGVPAAGGKYAAWLAYSRCMRSHGVPNFPDPKQVGGGIQIAGSHGGVDPHSPAFTSAEQACRHLQPGGGQSTNADQQRMLARMLHLSQCMRAHRIQGFPDPTLSPPSDRAGYSIITSNGVAWLAIPKSIDVGSPAFKQAAAACSLPLP